MFRCMILHAVVVRLYIAREAPRMIKPDHLRQVVFAIFLGLTSSLVQGALPTDPIQENEKEALFPSTSLINHGKDVAETACAPNATPSAAVTPIAGAPRTFNSRIASATAR